MSAANMASRQLDGFDMLDTSRRVDMTANVGHTMTPTCRFARLGCMLLLLLQPPPPPTTTTSTGQRPAFVAIY